MRASLVAPGESQQKEVRYLDIQVDQLDEAEFADWVKQASQLPGEPRLVILKLREGGRAITTMKKATTTTKKTKSGGKEGKTVALAKPSPRPSPKGKRGEIEIDARITEPSDWRSEVLARVRKLIHDADPEVVEEVKWRKPSNLGVGVPVWSHDGIICTGETYKDKVKLTFARGASLPSGLFNAGLEGNTRRAIDFHEGDKIDEKALKALIRAAVALNASA